MVDGLLANLGVGIASRFLSSPLATGFLCTISYWIYSCSTMSPRGRRTFSKASMTNRLLHVDDQKTFPDVPSKFHVSDCKLWSRLSIPPRLGVIAG